MRCRAQRLRFRAWPNASLKVRRALPRAFSTPVVLCAECRHSYNGDSQHRTRLPVPLYTGSDTRADSFRAQSRAKDRQPLDLQLLPWHRRGRCYADPPGESYPPIKGRQRACGFRGVLCPGDAGQPHPRYRNNCDPEGAQTVQGPAGCPHCWGIPIQISTPQCQMGFLLRGAADLRVHRSGPHQ